MRKFKALIFAVILCLLTSTVYALAVTKNNVSKNKVWTIKFNSNVDLNSINEGVLLTDSKGQAIDFTAAVGEDNKSIVIFPPEGGYQSGESYNLSVTKNVKSNKGAKLKEASEVRFNVKEYSPSKEDIKKYDEAAVNIESFDYNNEITASGTGFIIDGKIATNYKIIDKAVKVVVTLYNGTKYDVNGVYDYNKDYNIAVLKVEEHELPSLTSSSFDDIQAGIGRLKYNINGSKLKTMLNSYELQTLYEVKNSIYGSMSVEELEKQILNNYSNLKVGDLKINFQGVIIIPDENNKDALNILLVMGENASENVLDLLNRDSDKCKKEMEKVLREINDLVEDQYPHKSIDSKLFCNFSNPVYLTEFNDDEITYNSSTKTWSTVSPVVIYTSVDGENFFMWNRSYK